MSLDCNTPKGREDIRRQHEAAALLARRYPGLGCVHTDDEKEADIDALFHRSGKLAYVAEIKSRDMTLRQFDSFKREWLITADKIERGIVIARGLMVPLIGVLYMWPEKWLFVQKLWDIDGRRAKWRTARTETQATTNGGKATRVNAYVTVSDKGWQPPEAQSHEDWLRDYKDAYAQSI